MMNAAIRTFIFIVYIIVLPAVLMVQPAASSGGDGPGGIDLPGIGSRGERVRAVQERLQKYGYYPRNGISGYYGLTTFSY